MYWEVGERVRYSYNRELQNQRYQIWCGEFARRKMASITGPQILLHSRSPSLKLKLKPSSAFLLFPNPPFSGKCTRRRAFCSINSNSKPHASTSIVPDLLHYLNHSWTQFHATGLLLTTLNNQYPYPKPRFD